MNSICSMFQSHRKRKLLSLFNIPQRNKAICSGRENLMLLRPPAHGIDARCMGSNMGVSELIVVLHATELRHPPNRPIIFIHQSGIHPVATLFHE